MNGTDKVVFGDFQTPLELARAVARLALDVSSTVSAVVEPTCGEGSFLLASAEIFGATAALHGFDINPNHVRRARAQLAEKGVSAIVECEDFYRKDWLAFFKSLPPGVLVIGNPPWVTNAALGGMQADNLPEKTNFQKHSGLAAKTGKANFDISEWMLIRLLEALQGTESVLTMLCKTTTARKVLRFAWKNQLKLDRASLHSVDAAKHFGVCVDACLLVAKIGTSASSQLATAYADLAFTKPRKTFGMAQGELVSDLDAYRELSNLDGQEYRRWRSGVKHDAARVMEFQQTESGYVNGLDETWDLESERLFPLLKSSDLANGRVLPKRHVLLTQQRMSDDTADLETSAPLTWRYLVDHAGVLDQRKSSIHAKRPRFSVFGIGPYTFAPWKVAISGLYKRLTFQVLGTHDGKPIVVDDTCYFIPCESEEEATFFADLLNSPVAIQFLECVMFPDSKRPVTIDVLRRLDLIELAARLGKEDEASRYLVREPFEAGSQKALLFSENADR